MSTTPPPTPSLSDAITAVETAGASYTGAVTQTNNDQALATAAQKKADDAKATVTQDQAAQGKAAAAYNGALDQLIEAATAAKIPAPASTP